jgi:hypothetical protein
MVSISIGDLPLVARDSEIAALRSALDAAQRGVGSAVCIVGPGGIGKTRLATESLRTARQQGFRCAWGAGWSEAGVPPLWPWQTVLTQLGCDHAALSGLALAAGDESEQQRFATFQSVADAIISVASIEPVLIVIDDAHASDLGALLLTRFLVRTLHATAVHIVITAREARGDDPAVRTALDDLGHDAMVIRPAPLTIDGLGELLRQIGRPAPEAELAEMHDLSGGNPLFVGELIAAGATPSLVSAGSVRAILQLRLRSLPEQARELLAAAAMLGPLARTPTVLAVVGVDAAPGADFIRAAELAGVLAPSNDDRCVFTHRLLAEAVLAAQSTNDLCTLHARVADVLEHTDPVASEHVLATAHHRLAVAGIRRDEASVVEAVAACRRAAHVLVAGLAYEAASQLLARAVALHDQEGFVAPTALLIEVAATDLAAGTLLTARSWFRRAADQADDPVDLARAAVGLGGIWVHEHRTAAEHASFMALVDQAIAGLGDTRPDLTARLRMRAAAEAMYTGGGSRIDALAALEAARQLEMPLVLAESLSLWHHTLLGPANTGPDRMRVADELVRVAAAAGDDVLGLMGLLWRAIDLLLAGDVRADRALTEVRVKADALQVAAVLFVLDAIDVMRLLRDGRIDDAEQAAERCFELGTAIGDADAVGYLGGHLLTIRWLQLRPHEILPLARSVARSPTLVEGDVAPQAAAAVLAAMLGDDDQAKADLRHVMGAAPRSEQTSSNWMITMFCAAETALLLSDLKTAEAVYAALLPYRHLPIMGSVGVVCLGSAERSLGVAARTLGDVNLAVHHFEQALDHNHRLNNRVMASIAQGELGCALIERACPGDVAAGRAHVDASLAMLAEFGLTTRVDRLRVDAQQLLTTVPVPDGHMTQVPAGWRLSYGDHSVDIADSVGVQRLRHLLRCPWTDLAASDLAAPGLAGVVDRGPRHEINDAVTLRTYRDRIDEMRAEIDQADSDHDIERASVLREELDELLDHLGPSIGLRGRTRAFSDSGERARVAVRKSLGRVFEAVHEQDPEFGRHLHDSIRTGAICRFEPVNQFPSVWHSHHSVEPSTVG